MTTAMRGMSLATRADIEYAELLQNAQERCKNPIKLSWEKLKFEAQVPTTPAERQANPQIGNTKRIEIVKEVSGYAAPG